MHKTPFLSHCVSATRIDIRLPGSYLVIAPFQKDSKTCPKQENVLTNMLKSQVTLLSQCYIWRHCLNSIPLV